MQDLKPLSNIAYNVLNIRQIITNLNARSETR